jgi:phenylpropionate dioxygenase-like ring-hydroxylating dioxygenase large terminal subunit
MTRFQNYLRDRKPGATLPREFYVDPEIYRFEQDSIFRGAWSLVGHTASIRNAGDYFCCEIGDESFIVIRETPDRVNAFVNLCLHRGCRLIDQASGCVKQINCPYHNWVYDTSGALLSARDMPADFDPQTVRLIPCQLRILSGLIFICASPSPNTDFDSETAELHELLDPLQLDHTSIAAEHRWTVEGNWKLLIENFDECYHCNALHPEYCNVMAHARAEALGSRALRDEYEQRASQWRAAATQLGRSTMALTPSKDRAAWYGRFPLKAGCKTQSRDGQLIAPLLGQLPQSDEGTTSFRLYPLTYVIIPADYAVLIRFVPKSAECTEVHLTWLVTQNAQQGVDYDKSELTWLWRTTTEQDNAIVALNQKGVRSHFWTGGHYSNSEEYCEVFLEWYTSLMNRSDLTQLHP